MPSCRQTPASTRASDSVSSQRSAWPALMHSPLNPELMLTDAPISGAMDPAMARQVMPSSPANATAAPVPRVIEQARLAISFSAAFRSPPRDWNSYCTVVEAGGCLGTSGSVSKFNATRVECPLPPFERNADSLTTHRGAFQL